MAQIFEYDVFLSFASADNDIVTPIWNELSSCGLRVFWSNETLKNNIGQSFFSVIEEALSKSRHFLLVCTNATLQSSWVREEYEAFFSQCYIPSNRKRRFLIYPAKGFELFSLPTLLKNIQVGNSIDEIVSLLGGINIQALKKENLLLKSQIESLNNNILALEKENSTLKVKNKQTLGSDVSERLKKRVISLETELKRLEFENKKLKEQTVVINSTTNNKNSNVKYRTNRHESKLNNIITHKGQSFKVTKDGFLSNFDDWNHVWVDYIKEQDNISEIKDSHNKVIQVLREYFKKNGIAPMVRVLCKLTKLKPSEIYRLFPSGPQDGACKMAGLPHATGCV